MTVSTCKIFRIVQLVSNPLQLLHQDLVLKSQLLYLFLQDLLLPHQFIVITFQILNIQFFSIPGILCWNSISDFLLLFFAFLRVFYVLEISVLVLLWLLRRRHCRWCCSFLNFNLDSFRMLALGFLLLAFFGFICRGESFIIIRHSRSQHLLFIICFIMATQHLLFYFFFFD